MTDDGDEPATLSTLATIAAITGAAGTAASTGLALSKGGGGMPKLPPPKAPPPAPPPPAPAPPAALDTQAEAAVGKDRRKRQTRYGLANTLLASPLGGSSGAGTPTATLLGG